MDEDILAIGGFFFTVIVLALGLPLIKVWADRKKREPSKNELKTDARLERMEQAIDAMAVEIERISEGQRFVTKLLAEREKAPAVLPPGEPR
ncbi:MAG: hypothetical protein KF689_11075 [Gemmatimonadaceae bacterium]|nr:hypothetical protein [Gemmatimonadaceae bacterium]MCW5825863.1 hypothetical protein [Gemmatimonadaceae bacterium]